MHEPLDWSRTLPAGAWPDHLPQGLRLRLTDALGYAQCSADDLWDAITDWFAEEGIAGPARLLTAAPAARAREPGSVKFARAVS